MNSARCKWFAIMMVALAFKTSAQNPLTSNNGAVLALNESGRVVLEGHSTSFLIRRLPLNAFPHLPAAIAGELTERGCLIPQTYEAHRPENVVHASLEKPGSSDWAVLCSAQGTVSLLVFFESAPQKPITLASVQETDRLQRYDSSGILGFSWGIDPASPEHVHEAQIGLARRPPAPDHDALADSIIDKGTVYHFFSKGKWSLLDMPEE